MSLETAIRERWGNDGALAALVPIVRFFIGPWNVVPALPYVVLLSEQENSVRRTSSGTTFVEQSLRFRVWTADADQAEQIAEEMERVFERSDFEFDAGSVLNLQRREQTGKPLPDGSWHALYDYTALVQRAG